MHVLIETIRVRGGQNPFLDRHEARLRASLAALGLPPLDRPLKDLVAPKISKSELVWRVAVSQRGVEATTRDVPDATPLRLVTARTWHVPYRHKTTRRDPFDAALAEAVKAGADDALLCTREGWVAEGTIWSVFWWEGHRLRTPAVELGILPGIGRGRVMELAAVEEGRFRVADVRGRSVFLANAVRGIVAVGLLDGEPIPEDARTGELSQRFWPD